jgi:hypothetical protein
MMTITSMLRDNEDGDYGCDGRPMTKSRAFAAISYDPRANTEYERRNITITGPSTDAKAQIMHTKNGIASGAATSANGCLTAKKARRVMGAMKHEALDECLR